MSVSTGTKTTGPKLAGETMWCNIKEGEEERHVFRCNEHPGLSHHTATARHNQVPNTAHAHTGDSEFDRSDLEF